MNPNAKKVPTAALLTCVAEMRVTDWSPAADNLVHCAPSGEHLLQVHKGEEMDAHIAKLDRLYHGQGVVEK